MYENRRRRDITWFIEAICAASAVAGITHFAGWQPVPARCRVVNVRERIERVERLALPPPPCD